MFEKEFLFELEEIEVTSPVSLNIDEYDINETAINNRTPATPIEVRQVMKNNIPNPLKHPNVITLIAEIVIIGKSILTKLDTHN